MQHHTPGRGVFHLPQNATAVTAHVHHGAHIAIRDDDHRIDIRLIHMVDCGRLRPVSRVVNQIHGLISLVDLVNHAWCGCEKAKVELSLEALLHDFHMEQTEEAAAEAKAKRSG